MQHRLYVGLNNGETVLDVEKEVAQFIAAATIYSGRGLWQGSSEPCVIVEVVGEDKLNGTAAIVESLARHLRHRFHQTCVLYTRHHVESKLI